MATVFNLERTQILHSASQYPRSTAEAHSMGLTGGKNQEARAMTIAGFRIAQNNDQLTQRVMNPDVLLHVLAGSKTAIAHWETKGRLSLRSGGYSLTTEGLVECEKALLVLAGGYSTTEEKVLEWVRRILNSDGVATLSKTFPVTAWSIE